MLRSGKSQSARQNAVLAQTFDSLISQREIFEIDRSNLVRQLRTIRRAINESAEEMEMVAIEQVFVKRVSQTLIRTARKLYRVSEDLNGLQRLIERAHAPGALDGSDPKPKPRNRPKSRD
jgi:chaperonin cofactor prefoldin